MKGFSLFFALCWIGITANAQYVFSENFNYISNYARPTAWTVYGDGVTNNASWTDFNDSWQGFDHCAVSVSCKQISTASDRWLITPQIALPTSGNLGLLFKTVINSNYTEGLKVLISSSGTAKNNFDTTLAEYILTEAEGNHYMSLSSFAGENIHIAFVNNGNGLYVSIDDVCVGTFPTDGVEVLSLSAPRYTPLGDSIPVGMIVKNCGTESLSSFSYTYSINGDSDSSVIAAGLSIAPFAIDTIYFFLSHNEIGQINIEVNASSPNGLTNGIVVNGNQTATIVIYDPQYAIAHTVLIEDFETTSVPYTPNATNRISEALSQTGCNHVWITHHAGFNTDNMTSSASERMLGLYGTTSTWAPALMIDRDKEHNDGYDGVVGSVSQVPQLIEKLTSATSVPAFVEIGINYITYDTATRILQLTIEGQFLSGLELSDPRLTVWLTEDSIVLAQSAYTDEHNYYTITDYVHNHVLRTSLSYVWGDYDMFNGTSAGNTFSKSYTYVLPSDYDAGHCHVVAFVSNYDEENIFNRKVMNATQQPVPAPIEHPLSISGKDITPFNVTVAEGTLFITGVEGRPTQIYDAMGRIVSSQSNATGIIRFDIPASGIYLIKVDGYPAKRIAVLR